MSDRSAEGEAEEAAVPAVRPSYDLGGVALVDVVTMRPLNEVPFQQYTDQRQVATRNAIDVQIVNGRLRLYLVADDDDSDLLVYEAHADQPGAG